jgi:hypothetical protein
MAGEFVRTPKKGIKAQRYRARADLPLIEIGLCLFSLASVVASVETGHWFAAPFAMLFTFGYGYVATLVASEQLAGRKAVASGDAALDTLQGDAPPHSLAPESYNTASASSEELAA